MGNYLNPGNASFAEAINSEIFVDKTGMIGYLNTQVKTRSKYICVSRPRRFGKTTAADMICAYYDRTADSRELFDQLLLAKNTESIASWDRYLGQFDVIRIVMTDFMENCRSVHDMIEYLTEEVTEELIESNQDIAFGDRITLRTVMNKIYGKTDRQFVVVIDEWDAVFREWKEDQEGQTEFLDFLRNWLKDKPYVALAYMTGILPIKKYGKHSALNMFTEYSMMFPGQLAKYTGFTEDEVKAICSEKKIRFEAMKEWYDGYRLSDMPSEELVLSSSEFEDRAVYEIYSPLSVVNAVRFRRLENYWNKTETYEALAEYIRKDYDGLKDAVALLMDGGRLKIDTSSYQNDMTTFHGRDDVLSLLIHLGYLGYDAEAKEVFIPNREILDEFRTSTGSDEWKEVFKAYETSEELLKHTWKMDAEKVAELLEDAHNRAGNRTYNDEAALSYAVQLAYYAAQKYYTTIVELDSGKGYADLAYLPSPKYPDIPALVIELKYNKDAETALSQIKRQEYPARLEHYRGNILLVGIDYDRTLEPGHPEYKHHHCVIEKA